MSKIQGASFEKKQHWIGGPCTYFFHERQVLLQDGSDI